MLAAGCGVLLAAAAAYAAAGAGAGPAGESSEGSLATGSGSSGTVTVTKGDIRNVLSLNAELVARPAYTVLAPVGGTFQPRVQVGATVRPGEVLATVQTKDGQVSVTATARAEVLSVAAASGEQVPLGIPLVSLRSQGFALRAAVAPADRYRLTAMDAGSRARASIDKGPGPFDCPVLGGPQQSDGGDLSVLCAPPDNIRVFAGLRGILAIDLEKRGQVLTLPLTAVAGSADSGQVNLVDSAGNTTVHSVTLGITDGIQIEIRSGLTEGQSVAARPPALDTPAAD
ncbi:hypothetical protein [Streptomyces sp. H39-C1]|uniref:hypothetical protein n=1 Tax=Streptomyces sp. H39-C1 TaxID=3004355 RepID=UPI0022B02275|nr:hypothetical protein [Streptomyces sp. H39-C1]MCZ4101162.1 hypothetical protein [Streptomyces sp. H39-C1]